MCVRKQKLAHKSFFFVTLLEIADKHDATQNVTDIRGDLTHPSPGGRRTDGPVWSQ